MVNLVCAKCGSQKPVPQVGDWPGIPSKKDATQLTCPVHGERCATVDIPRCCGVAMEYVRLKGDSEVR